MRGLQLRLAQFALFAAIMALWFVLTEPGLVPNFYFDNPNQAAFFFGQPIKVFAVIWDWFASGKHLQASGHHAV